MKALALYFSDEVSDEKIEEIKRLVKKENGLILNLGKFMNENKEAVALISTIVNEDEIINKLKDSLKSENPEM